MAVDAVNSTVMAYQGSSSEAAAVKYRNPKAETEQSVQAPEVAAREPVNFDTRQAEDNPEESEYSSQNIENNGTNNKQLQEAVEKFKKNMHERTEAVFGFHEGTNRVTIKIIDRDTKDVLKEYPPEKTLDMIQKVWEMAGIMVDEKK